jgi:hypothetical protein
MKGFCWPSWAVRFPKHPRQNHPLPPSIFLFEKGFTPVWRSAIGNALLGVTTNMPQRRCRMQGRSLREGRVRSFLVRTRATFGGLFTITFLKRRIVIASEYHIYHRRQTSVRLHDDHRLLSHFHAQTDGALLVIVSTVERLPSCSDSAFLMADSLSGLIRKSTAYAKRRI